MKLLIVLLLSLASISPNRAASCADTFGVAYPTTQSKAFPAFKKPTLFKYWNLKKIKKGMSNGQRREVASITARVALWLLIASFFLGFLSLWATLLAYLLSIALSIVVLTTERNKRSLKLARLVLILCGALLLLSILLFLYIIFFFRI